MSYDAEKYTFSFDQLKSIHGGIKELNQGSNHIIAPYTNKNYVRHTSTNQEPYDMSVEKGEKMPYPLTNTE